MKINYTAYKSLLKRRIISQIDLTTESNIRELFVYTNGGKIEIETPYIQPQKAKKKTPLLVQNCAQFKRTGKNLPHADLYIEDCDVVIEFKYHKKAEYSDTAKTMNMGEVFRDLNRLSTLDNKEKYFIYVFDQEMKEYYDKHVFDILKVNTNKGATLKSIDIETLIKGKKVKDFRNVALSSFDRNIVTDFNYFSYTTNVLYSSHVTTYKKFDGKDDNMYMIVLQVN